MDDKLAVLGMISDLRPDDSIGAAMVQAVLADLRLNDAVVRALARQVLLLTKEVERLKHR